MTEAQNTLYEEIGGASVIAQLVDDFYRRVLSDADLRGFFEETSVERLTKMQNEFFAAALDGPLNATDIDLARIHHGRGINRGHLKRFVDHLIAVLDEHHKIEPRHAMDIIYRIATYSDQIIDGSGASDG